MINLHESIDTGPDQTRDPRRHYRRQLELLAEETQKRAQSSQIGQQVNGTPNNDWAGI